MKIFVKAKTGAREDKVIPPSELVTLFLEDRKLEEPFYTVHVKERPVEGRANEAIARVLAEHFGVSRSQVRLLKGSTSKTKLFEIK